ncbi:MAG: DUF4382 domain-containing protein [Steroidobacteraceae bacterium]
MTVDRARLPRRLLWTACALALGLATLAGCHPSDLVTYGTGVVTMYDAGGDTDFVSYIVSIDSITLTRNDGLVIEPFVTPEIIDLAKLHDLTELVENPAIPIGTYTSLTLLLDYTAPDITVNVNGVVTAATPVDTTGADVLTVSLTVNFDPNNPLVINALECARLAIDLNLAASNTVNFSASPLTVTVQSMITATPAPEDSTVMRARGILVVTQPDMSNYIVNMRPFQDLVSALGALTVNTSATTYFNINGVAYTGAAGLAAMNDLQVSTPVAAYGTLGSFSTITPGFTATAVYAGTSLESPLADYITGVVSARSGDTLTIHGANWLSSLGVLQSYAELPVTVDSATVVSEDGVAASGLSPQSISVGQLINVSGVSTLNSSNVVTALDASSAQVRLQPTPIWGTLNSGAAGSMSLDLLSIADFQPSVFSFIGTGSSAANDAVAAAYVVDTGTLNESGTAAGTLLQANGVVAPLGAAPPDFTATAVTAGTALPQQLVVEWDSGGTTAPFSSASSAGLVVNLANPNLSSTIRYIGTGPARTDLKTLPASPTIVFASGTPLTLAINSADTISVFNHVTGFATALASTLNGTNEVYRLVCVGQYSATSNTFTATQVSLNLEQ